VTGLFVIFRVAFLPLDLASLASVRQFVRRLAVLHPVGLHYLVLNAGVFGLGYSRTEDGLERTMQVNYLAHFYLVRLLLSRLVTGALTCRVVVLSSESHRFSETTPGT
jgi:WW domain-containing oxidoreductase